MNRILESFRDGGWGMWPVLVFGLLAVVAAARFAWRGEHRLTPFVRWMTATTLSSAVLGFAMAMMAVFNYLVTRRPEGDQLITILFEGTKEALNCITFGLLMTTLTCLLLAVGHRRHPAPDVV